MAPSSDSHGNSGLGAGPPPRGYSEMPDSSELREFRAARRHGRLQRAKRILLRSLRLRCPACGDGRIYRRLVRMRPGCSHCGLVYEREQGYFVGAIYINVIATEMVLGSVWI